MIYGIVLAGGLGKRMKSHLPKPCLPVNGRPMIQSVINNLETLCDKIFIVFGQKGDLLKQHVLNHEKYIWCHQDPQLGTGHALQIAFNHILKHKNPNHILVCNGDAPFIKQETLKNLITDADATLLGCEVKNPFGYGRLIKNPNFEKIVEEKDCNDEERKINEVNAGAYSFKFDVLKEYIFKLNDNNAQKEFYLTDLFGMISNVNVYTINDELEIFNINNPEQLQEARQITLDNLTGKYSK